MASAAGLALCAGASIASGQQVFYTYSGPLDGVWNATGNWTPAGIPGSGAQDVATIPSGARCTHSGIGPLGRAVDKLFINAGGQLEIGNDFELYIRGQSDGAGVTGLLTVPGTLVMSSIGNTTDLILSGSTFVTFGGGTPSTPALIEMGNNFQNRIFGISGSERLDIQPAAVIRGSGQVGLNLMSIANQGSILARGSTGMTIDPNNAGLTNTGTLGADTGPLTLYGGTFDNTGGEIVADAASVYLVHASVFGGVLNTTGSAGAIVASSPGGSTTIRDLSNLGTLRLPNDYDGYMHGTITNSGNMFLESVGNSTDIYLPANLTLVGPGRMEMSNNYQNRIFDASGNRGFVLTNAGTHTIVGSGQIGLNSIDVVNQAGATILAQGSTGLHIDPADTFTNLGTLVADDGGSLVLTNGTFVMTAPVVAKSGGKIYLNGGSFTGTFSSLGTGECRINTFGGGSVLSNVTNNGQFNFHNEFDASVTGTLTNNGTISMLSVGNATDLYLTSHVTLNGSGTLAMSNNAQNRIFDASGNRGFVLTNASTIVGSGQIGLNTIEIVNSSSGVIAASGSSRLYIDPAVTFMNNGVLRADAGGVLELHPGTYTFNTPVTAMNDGVVAFHGGTFSGQVASQGTGVCAIRSFGGNSAFSNLINLGRIDQTNDYDVIWINTIDNRGTYNMGSFGNSTDVYVYSNVSLVGGGTISMSNNANNNFFDAAGNRGHVLTNVSNTITGAGRIGLNTIDFVNGASGSVLATLPTGIEFDPASTFTNNGTLRAQSGSILRFYPGTYQFNTPAVAEDGGFVLLTGGTYSGSVDSEGAGEVHVASFGTGSALTNFTNLGTLALQNDNDVGVYGSIVNHGTIAMRSVGNSTDMYVLGHTTLSGTGTVSMSNTSQNNIFDPWGNRGFVFTVAQPITGSGQIGLNSIDLVNTPQGVIHASVSGGIYIDAAASFSNQGELRASGGNIGIIGTPTFTNTGTIVADAGRLIQSNLSILQTAGVTIANGEVQVDNDIFNLQGGLIIGSGRVDSTVNNTAGMVSPGNSTNDTPSFALLTIEGNFNQSETGETLIELGGPTLGTEYDRVAVTGVANTGGVLRIRLVDGYSPVLGTTYDILTAASIAGGYDTIVAENIPFNNQLSLSILSDRIRVVFDIRCLGDYDGDGGITGADIAAFFEDFEAGSAAADLDQDGGITGSDIGEFFARFEAGC
jgi:hypothetical protein